MATARRPPRLAGTRLSCPAAASLPSRRRRPRRCQGGKLRPPSAGPPPSAPSPKPLPRRPEGSTPKRELPRGPSRRHPARPQDGQGRDRRDVRLHPLPPAPAPRASAASRCRLVPAWGTPLPPAPLHGSRTRRPTRPPPRPGRAPGCRQLWGFRAPQALARHPARGSCSVKPGRGTHGPPSQTSLPPGRSRRLLARHCAPWRRPLGGNVHSAVEKETPVRMRVVGRQRRRRTARRV